jgi:hypothetical protein
MEHCWLWSFFFLDPTRWFSRYIELLWFINQLLELGHEPRLHYLAAKQLRRIYYQCRTPTS